MAKVVLLTLFVNITSSIIAMIIGVCFGYKLYYCNLKMKKYIIVFNRTMMSLPPVVLGLTVYILFRRNGVFAPLQWLYTVKILIVTQVLLIIPIITGHFYDMLENSGDDVMFYLKALGANKKQQFVNMLFEEKNNVIIIFTIGFSRAVSEVGAIMITGGNIRGKTRMMTTSISMLQSQGEIEMAMVYGAVLLIIAFIIQFVLQYFKES
ncbi:MAG: ABC transporter permease [Lachnospirales bacterium]